MTTGAVSIRLICSPTDLGLIANVEGGVTTRQRWSKKKGSVRHFVVSFKVYLVVYVVGNM